MISFQGGRVVKRVFYNKKGQIHRIGDKPALIYQPSSDRKCVEYYQNGVLHRFSNPAKICWIDDEVVSEQFYLNGSEKSYKMHLAKKVLEKSHTRRIPNSATSMITAMAGLE